MKNKILIIILLCASCGIITNNRVPVALQKEIKLLFKEHYGVDDLSLELIDETSLAGFRMIIVKETGQEDDYPFWVIPVKLKDREVDTYHIEEPSLETEEIIWVDSAIYHLFRQYGFVERAYEEVKDLCFDNNRVEKPAVFLPGADSLQRIVHSPKGLFTQSNDTAYPRRIIRSFIEVDTLGHARFIRLEPQNRGFEEIDVDVLKEVERVTRMICDQGFTVAMHRGKPVMVSLVLSIAY